MRGDLLRVKEIMDSKHPVIHGADPATKARALVRDYNLRILPVVDENNKLLGIISRGNLLTISSSVSPIQVKGIMANPKYVASVDDDTYSAVKQMIRLDEWYVPVVNSAQDKTYRGVLGLDNFIEAIIRTSPEKLAKPVSAIMSTNVVCCSPDDEVEQVWRLMQKESFSGVPVVKKEKLVGMITQKDLLESGKVLPGFESKKGRFRASPKVSMVMKENVVAVEPSVKAIGVAKAMISRDIGRVPVTDEKGKLVGIVDREDVARLIVK
jgi:CBS domain-containing protein